MKGLYHSTHRKRLAEYKKDFENFKKSANKLEPIFQKIQILVFAQYLISWKLPSIRVRMRSLFLLVFLKRLLDFEGVILKDE